MTPLDITFNITTPTNFQHFCNIAYLLWLASRKRTLLVFVGYTYCQHRLLAISVANNNQKCSRQSHPIITGPFGASCTNAAAVPHLEMNVFMKKEPVNIKWYTSATLLKFLNALRLWFCMALCHERAGTTHLPIKCVLNLGLCPVDIAQVLYFISSFLFLPVSFSLWTYTFQSFVDDITGSSSSPKI